MATGRIRLNQASPPVAASRPSAAPMAQVLPGGPGHPIDGAVRSFFEPRFGHDLGHVRIHRDEEAARAAADLQAQAYTLGEHIVFGEDRYRPTTHDGRSLLAHELMHVLQQPGAAGATGSIGRADDAAEAQARAAAAAQGMPPNAQPLVQAQAQLALQEADSGDGTKVNDLAQRDRLAGTLISRIVANVGSGRVTFVGRGVTIFGTVSTDLGPGVYTIHPDYGRKRWVIEDPVVAVGKRFNVTLEGALPWTLAYPERLKLSVGASQEWTHGTPPGDEFSMLELQDEAQPVVEDEERDIDSFDSCSYHLDYRSVGGNASKWLRCTYASGKTVDINLDWIHDGSTPGFDRPAALDALGDLRVPSELTASTAPRLSEQKRAAINAMYEQTLFIMDKGMMAYSIASMGVGLPMGTPSRGNVGVGSGRPSRTSPRIDPDIDAEVEAAFSKLPDEGVPATPGAPGGQVKSGVGVRVPVTKTGEPAEVLAVGAGRQRKSDLGLPEDGVNITKSDIDATAKPDVVLDATKPIPAAQQGQHTALIINNPHGYTPNIGELAKALKPGGKIIVQSNWGANKYFRALGTGPVPKGMTRTIERDVPIMGSGFRYTDPARKGAPVPDSRITFEMTAAP